MKEWYETTYNTLYLSKRFERFISDRNGYLSWNGTTVNVYTRAIVPYTITKEHFVNAVKDKT